MTQKGLNERIAMSLLTQCAWMWEYCTRNPNDGEFQLGDVVKGLTARNRYGTKPGYTMVEMTLCERWEHFADGIDGLKYFDRQTGEVTLWFGDYHCQYVLADVFKIAAAFCRATGCSSLANKAVFGCEGSDRYCRLPEVKDKKMGVLTTLTTPTTQSTPRTRTTPTIQRTPAVQTTTPLSLADRLRAALMARLAA